MALCLVLHSLCQGFCWCRLLLGKPQEACCHTPQIHSLLPFPTHCHPAYGRAHGWIFARICLGCLYLAFKLVYFQAGSRLLASTLARPSMATCELDVWLLGHIQKTSSSILSSWRVGSCIAQTGGRCASSLNALSLQCAVTVRQEEGGPY